MVTISITDTTKLAGIAAACAAYNSTLPEDVDELTPEQYFQNIVDNVANSYVIQYKIGTVFASDYVLRFTGAEWAAINTAAETDQLVAGYLQRVRSVPEVNIFSEEVVNGHQYLIANNLLTVERSAEILV